MMNNDKNIPNVPTLRFDDFSDNWTISTLGDVCSYRKERRTAEKKYYVSTENILQNYQGIECFDSNEKISGDAFDKNDVLMGNIRPYLKKVCFANFDGVCNADVLVFKNKSLNPRYLHCILANDSFINYVMSSVKGSKMPRGDKNFIMQYPLSYPSELEQAKISNFIETLTKRIEVQNKIISKYETLIKGLGDRIFRHNKTIPLSDLVICKTSTFQENEVVNDNSGQYNVFGASGIIASVSNYQFDRNAILVLKDGSKAGKIQYASGKYSVVGTSVILIPKIESDAKYLYFAMLAIDFGQYKVGSGIPHIYFKDYSSEKIYYPDEMQRNRIEKTLTTYETKLGVEKRMLSALLKQKAFFLQSMFI